LPRPPGGAACSRKTWNSTDGFPTIAAHAESKTEEKDVDIAVHLWYLAAGEKIVSKNVLCKEAVGMLIFFVN
jgi:hypothetical protein